MNTYKYTNVIIIFLISYLQNVCAAQFQANKNKYKSAFLLLADTIDSGDLQAFAELTGEILKEEDVHYVLTAHVPKEFRQTEPTLLHMLATKKDGLPLLKALTSVRRDSAKDAIDNKGNTLLHCAALYGRAAIAHFLINTIKINVDVSNNEHMTPLFHACQNDSNPTGALETVTVLCNAGASLDKIATPYSTPCNLAIYYGLDDVAAYLIQKRHAFVYSLTNRHQTPLHVACEEKSKASESIVSLLCEQGAIVDAIDTKELTALNYAASSGKMKIALLLMQKMPHYLELTTNRLGSTLLHDAVRGGSLMLVKILLDEGVSADVPTQCGITPLHIATQHSRLNCIRHLIQEAGANPNAQTYDNKRTPLHWAYHQQSSHDNNETAIRKQKTIDLLCELGAQPNICDVYGWIPQSLCFVQSIKCKKTTSDECRLT